MFTKNQTAVAVERCVKEGLAQAGDISNLYARGTIYRQGVLVGGPYHGVPAGCHVAKQGILVRSETAYKSPHA